MSESKPKSAQDLYEAAQQLSSDERELLAAMLNQDEAPGFASPEIEKAWIEECNRRRQLVKEGKAGWVDGEQFMRELRKSLAE